MLMELLEHYAMGIRKPTRVVISVNPVHAVRPVRAKRLGVDYDMILVRKDGWSIGFRSEWRIEVLALFPDDWEAACYLQQVAVVRLASPQREGDR